MRQARVGDLGLGEVQGTELSQASEMHQVYITDQLSGEVHSHHRPAGTALIEFDCTSQFSDLGQGTILAIGEMRLCDAPRLPRGPEGLQECDNGFLLLMRKSPVSPRHAGSFSPMAQNGIRQSGRLSVVEVRR